MISIYQRALGAEFEKLHPEIQRRFSLTSEGGVGAVGTGVMDKLWHGAAYTLPFLYIGTWRSIMFPEQGVDVPFTIQNYAYRDSFGRETVTWVRTFTTRKVRRFDAYMIYDEERGCIIDYLGTHQHLAVELELQVESNGGLRIRSGAQRFHEGPVSFTYPMSFSGVADVCEWFDDREGCFRIEVSAANRRWGKLFGYSGRFRVDWKAVPANTAPADILPKRLERRT